MSYELDYFSIVPVAAPEGGHGAMACGVCGDVRPQMCLCFFDVDARTLVCNACHLMLASVEISVRKIELGEGPCAPVPIYYPPEK